MLWVHLCSVAAFRWSSVNVIRKGFPITFKRGVAGGRVAFGGPGSIPLLADLLVLDFGGPWSLETKESRPA